MRKENTGVPSQANVVISLIYLCRPMVSSRPSIPYRVDQHGSVLHTLLNAAHDERFPPQLLPPTSVWELPCTPGQGIGVQDVYESCIVHKVKGLVYYSTGWLQKKEKYLWYGSFLGCQ